MGLIYSDIPELDGRDTDLVLRNLKETEDELDRIVEKRLAHLVELSNSVINDGGDPDIIKSIILSLKSDSYDNSENIIEENRSGASAVYSRLSFTERMIICENIAKRLFTDKRLATDLLFGESDEISNAASERIAYLKNSYNDNVYMQFSALFSSPRAAYFESVTDVCESVYNENCEYCILPIETSSDGKLTAFYEIILKYGFKITAVYDLSHSENKKYTRYALLGKKLRRETSKEAVIKSKSKAKFFEFAVECDEYPTITDILCAADYCSMQLRRIDTLNFISEKSQKSPLICPVFGIDGSDFLTFMTFLSIDCPDFYTIGIYRQI